MPIKKIVKANKAAAASEYAILLSLVGAVSLIVAANFGNTVEQTLEVGEIVATDGNTPQNAPLEDGGAPGGVVGGGGVLPASGNGTQPSGGTEPFDCYDPARVGQIGPVGVVCEGMLIVDDTLLRSVASAAVGGNETYALQGPDGQIYTFEDSARNVFTGQVGNMGLLFAATSFNGAIGYWDMSRVWEVSYMFQNNPAFNQDISAWEMPLVNSLHGMFYGASAFNRDISGWDVSNVANFDEMFYGASAFNQTLNTWNMSSAVSLAGMFNGASSFNRPLNGWNVGNVASMQGMFANATAFNQPLAAWNMSSVEGIGAMFFNATSFNRPLNAWNVSAVIDGSNAFFNATSFNQPLASWNVSNFESMDNMFGGASSFNQDLSSWCPPKIADTPYDFDFGASAWAGGTTTRPQWGTCD